MQTQLNARKDNGQPRHPLYFFDDLIAPPDQVCPPDLSPAVIYALHHILGQHLESDACTDEQHTIIQDLLVVLYQLLDSLPGRTGTRLYRQMMRRCMPHVARRPLVPAV